VKGDALPDTDHVSRYCGGAQVKPDGTPSGKAFRLRMLRDGPEPYLSVNWLEFLEKADRTGEIEEIRQVLSRKLRLGSRAKIAVLNVGETVDHVHRNSEDRRVLRVSHEPETNPPDPSHSGIHNLRLDDELIAELIAQTIKKVYPAKGG